MVISINDRPLKGVEDLDNDDTVGFQVISTDDIDDLGIPAIIRKIRNRIGDSPVYLRCVYDSVQPVGRCPDKRPQK